MLKVFRLFSVMILLPIMAAAQNIGSYQLEENSKVAMYQSLSGSTLLIGSDKAETSSSAHGIGFEFVFMGKVYTTFSVNTNGVLRLGDEPVLSGANAYGIPGNDRIVPMAGVSVYYRYRACSWFWGCNDWWVGAVGDLQTSTSGKVHYKLSGNAPNRILTVEWKEMTFREGYQTAKTSFQVKLYESTLNSTENGRIDFIYGEFNLGGDYADFYFRTGFGIGPEQGNYIAIDHANNSIVTEQNYLSGPGYGNISYFRLSSGKSLMYQFQSFRKPTGAFSNFEQICPAPNALTIRFDENCADEAGIAVFRKRQNQPDHQFQFVTSLPPDSRSFSDGDVQAQQSYVYRFYFLGEGDYSDSYTDYVSQSVQPGQAFQAIGSGKWTNPAIWGGQLPAGTNDVELGCAKSVFVTADADAQVHNLTIHKGSFLTIEDGVSLHVSGNFVNNGVFNPIGSGRLVLNGSSAQALTNNGKGLTNDQVFTSDGDRPGWNDYETGVVAEKTISVSESGFSAIKSVKVDISHDYLRDLTLYLLTPDGTTFTLARGRGQQGEDYSDVVFTETGQPLPPTVQNVNLEGEYSPEESFAAYQGSFQGEWKLQVRDGFSGVGGRLNDFELTLSKGGSNDLVMRNITIQNTSEEGITLNSGIVVQAAMQFISGVLHTAESAPVVFEAGASCNEGNSGSFISGPALKRGNTNFVFPIGKDGKWAPLGINNIRNADATTTLKAEYFKDPSPSQEQKAPGIARISSNEYWDLGPTAGTPTLDISLYWKDAAFSGISDLLSGDLTVAHYTNGAWRSESASVVDSGDGTGVVKAANINTFSPFSFGSINENNPLPVSLVSFKAFAAEKVNLLQWKTASELNNSHFEIEKSSDGKKWQQIGVVEGNGTTNQLQEYSFADPQLVEGVAYYRLRQVDFDGKFEFSGVEYVERSMFAEKVSFYPNPTNSGITVKAPAHPAEIVLLNQAGAVVWKDKIHSPEQHFQLPDQLAAGIYIIQFTHVAGIEHDRLIIKK